MEHVEPDLVMNVLREVRRLCKVRGLFVIGMTPAQKTLADGRNAHLSLHTQEVWVQSLEAAGFTVEEQSNPEEKGHNSWFVVV
jgi:hypothetical protein